MRIVNCEQGSAEWLQTRSGKITASRISNVLAYLKGGGEKEERRNYRIELLAERLTGRAEEHYISPDMEHGTEWEPYARAAYEVETGAMVDQVGFALHPTLDFAGASPDGLIGADGGIEIKCPRTTTHLKWMLDGVVPEKHQAQMLWNMACCERQWMDFVSYAPYLPDGLKLFVVRMQRDDARIAEIEKEVEQFDAEIEGILATLRPRIVDGPTPDVIPDLTDDKTFIDELTRMVAGEIIP